MLERPEVLPTLYMSTCCVDASHLRAAGRPRGKRPAPAPAPAPFFLRASTRRIHSGVCSSSRSFHFETAFSSSVTISSSVERRTPVGVMTRPEKAGCTEERCARI